MRMIVLEGSRGVGKSTIGKSLREKVSEITLVNPTGYHLDNKEGHDKISEYYLKWMDFLWSMQEHDSTFVFDRFFFSERVFSELYKNYNFTNSYYRLLDNLHNMAEEIDVIFFTIDDEEELRNRLIRDKVPFGKAEESVAETLKQQEEYKKIMLHFEEEYTNHSIRLHRIDTSNKTPQEVEEEVLRIVRR